MKTFWPIILLTTAACATPTPFLYKASLAPDGPADPAALHRKAVRTAIANYYPQLMRRSAARTETVLFVTTTNGRVERTDLLRGEPTKGAELETLFRRFPDLRNDAARVATGVTRFGAGELGPSSVVVVWAERAALDKGKGPYRFAVGTRGSN
jgi:hypothetical protein